jgi:PAS domain-containing protein
MSLAEFETYALRRRAESQIARSDPPGDMLLRDPMRLLQELAVHRIELEMQNDELSKSNRRLEALRNEFQSLYDLAPVGYFTLSSEGLVLRMNDRAVQMMKCDRHSAINRPLRQRFASADVAAVDCLLRDAIQSNEGCASSDALLLLRPSLIPIYVRVQARSVHSEDDRSLNVLLAMMDVSALKFATDDVLTTLQNSLR